MYNWLDDPKREGDAADHADCRYVDIDMLEIRHSIHVGDSKIHGGFPHHPENPVQCERILHPGSNVSWIKDHNCCHHNVGKFLSSVISAGLALETPYGGNPHDAVYLRAMSQQVEGPVDVRHLQSIATTHIDPPSTPPGTFEPLGPRHPDTRKTKPEAAPWPHNIYISIDNGGAKSSSKGFRDSDELKGARFPRPKSVLPKPIRRGIRGMTRPSQSQFSKNDTRTAADPETLYIEIEDYEQTEITEYIDEGGGTGKPVDLAGKPGGTSAVPREGGRQQAFPSAPSLHTKLSPASIQSRLNLPASVPPSYGQPKSTFSSFTPPPDPPLQVPVTSSVVRHPSPTPPPMASSSLGSPSFVNASRGPTTIVTRSYPVSSTLGSCSNSQVVSTPIPVARHHRNVSEPAPRYYSAPKPPYHPNQTPYVISYDTVQRQAVPASVTRRSSGLGPPGHPITGPPLPSGQRFSRVIGTPSTNSFPSRLPTIGTVGGSPQSSVQSHQFVRPAAPWTTTPPPLVSAPPSRGTGVLCSLTTPTRSSTTIGSPTTAYPATTRIKSYTPSTLISTTPQPNFTMGTQTAASVPSSPTVSYKYMSPTSFGNVTSRDRSPRKKIEKRTIKIRSQRRLAPMREASAPPREFSDNASWA